MLGTNGRCNIPWMVIVAHEGKAICNHGRDLEALNSRRGLCWSEMIAVLEDRKWSKMNEMIARKKIEDIVRKNICTVQTIKNDGDHYIPLECCTITNPKTRRDKCD